MTTIAWRRTLKWLRLNFPIAAPVTVKRVKSKTLDGVTRFDGSNFNIRIAEDQSDSAQIDSLWHEWAHAKAIEETYHHCDRWGCIYAQINEAGEKIFHV
jgi:hypothetical protein